MNLGYSSKERLDKVVDILAEGVVSLIKSYATLGSTLSSRLGIAFQQMTERKKMKSCIISCSSSQADVEDTPESYHIEPCAKIKSLTQELSR